MKPNSRNRSPAHMWLEWTFLTLLPVCYLVPRLLGYPFWGAYDVKSDFVAFLFHPFFHLSVTHLVLNMIAFAGIISSYRLNAIFFVRDFFWSWALGLLAASLVVHDIPLMGSSGLMFVWLGIGYFYYLFLPVTLNRKVFLRWSTCLAISLVVSFLHPGMNGLLHLVAFLLGGMKSFASVLRKNFRALVWITVFFPLLSCSLTRELKTAEKSKEQTTQNHYEQTDEMTNREWDRWKNEQLEVEAQEIYFSTDTIRYRTSVSPVTKIVKYKMRYNHRDTAQMRSTTEKKQTTAEQIERTTSSDIKTDAKEKKTSLGFGFPLLLITILILFILQLIKFKR